MFTLCVLVCLTTACLFWYERVERNVLRLKQETLSIQYESHLLVAKSSCSPGRIIVLDTGVIQCGTTSNGTMRVTVKLKSGQTHTEVVRLYE